MSSTKLEILPTSEETRRAAIVDRQEALISAALENDSAAAGAIATLPIEAFEAGPHRRIARAIANMQAEGQPIDRLHVLQDTLPAIGHEHDSATWWEAENVLQRIAERPCPSLDPERDFRELAAHAAEQKAEPIKRQLAEAATQGATIAELSGLAEKLGDYVSESATQPYFEPMANWQEEAAKEIPWLVNDRIPRGCVTVFPGQSGGGKSMFLRGIALEVVTGKTLWKSWRIDEAGPCMVFSHEDAPQLYLRSMLAYADAHGIDHATFDKRIRENLFLRCLRPEPLAEADRFGNPTEAVGMANLRREARRIKPKLIVLDTLRRSHNLDENSNAQMGFIVQLLNSLAAELGCAIAVSHHISKASEGNQFSARGASSIIDESRAAHLVIPDREHLRVRHAKSNYAAIQPETVFRREGLALLEIETNITEPGIVNCMVDWLERHPEAKITVHALGTRGGADAKALLQALAERWPTLTPGEAKAIAEKGIQNGALTAVRAKNAAGKDREYIAATADSGDEE
jgi:hypothetical protein